MKDNQGQLLLIGMRHGMQNGKKSTPCSSEEVLSRLMRALERIAYLQESSIGHKWPNCSTCAILRHSSEGALGEH